MKFRRLLLSAGLCVGGCVDSAGETGDTTALAATSNAAVAGATITVHDDPVYVRQWNGVFSESGATKGLPQTVTATSRQAAIVGNFIGFSFNKESEIGTDYGTSHNGVAKANATLATLFKNLSRSGQGGLLRLGGTDVDCALWKPQGPEAWDSTARRGNITQQDVDNLAAFAHESNWQVLYGVDLYNYSTTPELAADEIAYVKSKFGDSLYGVEIGNEPDLYYKPANYGKIIVDPATGKIDPADIISNEKQFFARWSRFANAIRQRVPGITLTGPALGSTSEMFNSNKLPWMEPFMQDAQGSGYQLALVTQHAYPQTPNYIPASEFDALDFDSQASDLFAADTTNIPWETNLAEAATELSYLTNEYRYPAFRIDETNSYGDDYRPQVDASQASALWMIDHLFNIAIGGAAGANVISGPGNSFDSNSTFGFTYGYGDIDDIHPEYYGMLLFSMVGQGRLLETGISSTVPDTVTAYAVRKLNGDVYVVVNNKSTKQTSFSIDLQQMELGRDATHADLTLLTAPSLDSIDPTIQGARVNVSDGTFAFNAADPVAVSGGVVRTSIPAASAGLIRIGFVTRPITFKASAGLCMDDPQSTSVRGEYIQVHTCNSTQAQAFTATQGETGTYQLQNAASGLCLTEAKVGAAVVQETCSTAANQQWLIDANANGTYRITTPDSQACMSVPVADAPKVLLTPCAQAAMSFTISDAP